MAKNFIIFLNQFFIFSGTFTTLKFEISFTYFRKIALAENFKVPFLVQFFTLKTVVEKFFGNSNFSDFLGIKSEINQCDPIWTQGQIEHSLTYGPSEVLTVTADCLPQVGFKRTFVSFGSQTRSSLTSVTLTHPREASQDDPDSGLPPRSKFLKFISIWRSAGASRYQMHFASFGNWLFRDLLTDL